MHISELNNLSDIVKGEEYIYYLIKVYFFSCELFKLDYGILS